MPVFTADINERPVFVFFVEDARSAKVLVELESLRLELMLLICEGKQLWDGETEIITRLANSEERMVWERDSDGALDRLAFLVRVSEANE